MTDCWMTRLKRGYPDYLTKAESPKWRSLQKWKRRSQIAIFFENVIRKRGPSFFPEPKLFPLDRSFFWGLVDHFIRNNVFDQMRWNIGSRKSDPLNPPNNDRKKGRKNWRIAFEKGLLSQKCERKLETLSFSWVCNCQSINDCFMQRSFQNRW